MRPWVWRHQEGRGAPCHRRIQGGQSGRDLDCQGIVRRNVRGRIRLLNFAEPPGTVKGMIPDRGGRVETCQ